ncbi:MAG: single-stranded DNA-binding protein [Candidatus Caenarcaniphilales bacterium]|jgi:single-strand DNA-binding protein|nr:single-stranded DNA-binding protein [Candidatus Caenarcaniphilales bacterium]
MSLTSIVLSGTIKKKAEQKQTPNGNTVTNFMINVTRYDNREKQEKQYPVKVSIWGDAISDMLGKLDEGAKVIVSGRLQLDQFTDKNGKNIKLFNIEASRVQLANDIASGSGSKASSSSSPYDDYAETSSYSGSETDAYSSEQEVPF